MMDALKLYFLSYKPYISIAALTIAILVWVKLKDFVKKQYIDKGPHDRKEGRIQIFLNIFKYILAFAAVVIVLQVNGVNVSSVTAGLGIAGIVVGFSLQETLQDWIMGIGIIWDKYFTVGDVVSYGEYVGQVIKFNIKCTTIKEVDTGSLIIISNRHLSEIEIIADWFFYDIPAPLNEPTDKMRKANIEIARRLCENEDCKSCDFVGVFKFTEYAAMDTFKIGCNEAKRFDMKLAINCIAQDVYEENGIAFPRRE